MKEQLTKVLDMLQQQHQVEYADIRVHEIKHERISTQNQKVQNLSTGHTKGYGIRVFLNGCLGFAGSQDFSRMEETALTALAIAKASAIAQRKPLQLAPKETYVDHYQTPIKIDPFGIQTRKAGTAFCGGSRHATSRAGSVAHTGQHVLPARGEDFCRYGRLLYHADAL